MSARLRPPNSAPTSLNLVASGPPTSAARLHPPPTHRTSGSEGRPSRHDALAAQEAARSGTMADSLRSRTCRAAHGQGCRSRQTGTAAPREEMAPTAEPVELAEAAAETARATSRTRSPPHTPRPPSCRRPSRSSRRCSSRSRSHRRTSTQPHKPIGRPGSRCRLARTRYMPAVTARMPVGRRQACRRRKKIIRHAALRDTAVNLRARGSF